MNYSYSYIEQKAEDVLIQNDFFYIGFDVKKLAKKLKVEVLPKKLDDDVAGLFVRINDKPIISINQNQKNKSRERFTIAHELGHFCYILINLFLSIKILKLCLGIMLHQVENNSKRKKLIILLLPY